jgi:hypothetical protein
MRNKAKGIRLRPGAMSKEKKTSANYGRPGTEMAEAWTGRSSGGSRQNSKRLINHVGEEVV